jgi:lipoate-protein ligase B
LGEMRRATQVATQAAAPAVAAPAVARRRARPAWRGLTTRAAEAGEPAPVRELMVVNVRPRVSYARGVELMKELQEAKLAALRTTASGDAATEAQGMPCDALLLLEHEPVYTLGRGAAVSNVLFDPAAPGAPQLHRSERGGEVTFHGPGQVVGYPVLDLRRHRKDLHWYMRQVEEVVIRALQHWGVEGGRRAEYTGVWVQSGSRKVCAIGLNASKWVTSHGFALNATTDLAAFDKIVPCGISERGTGVTSLAQLHAERALQLDEEPASALSRTKVQERLVKEFMDVFGYRRCRVRELDG